MFQTLESSEGKMGGKTDTPPHRDAVMITVSIQCDPSDQKRCLSSNVSTPEQPYPLIVFLVSSSVTLMIFLLKFVTSGFVKGAIKIQVINAIITIMFSLIAVVIVCLSWSS